MCICAIYGIHYVSISVRRLLQCLSTLLSPILMLVPLDGFCIHKDPENCKIIAQLLNIWLCFAKSLFLLQVSKLKKVLIHAEKIYLIYLMVKKCIFLLPARRKMDVQLWDSHLICSIVLSRCSTLISKILISAYFNILDITPEYLDITTKHIRWLSHS